MNKKQKVMVAMSGGVDSSIAALLLKEQGYDVIGVMMELGPVFPNPAVEDARQVADSLEIPFQVADFREIFKSQVIEYFIKEYVTGKTPNPCVICNPTIKFGVLLEKAKEMGCDFLATGHYVRTFFEPSYGRFVLKKGVDPGKDQSYVLFSLTQEQLARVILPLGGYAKSQIREMAIERGLPVAEKPESQEICFIPDNNYRRFIKEYGGEKIQSGPFLDTRGSVIGRHQGLPYYTIGQRKGLGLAMGRPVYVVDIVPKKNAVVIGEQEDLMGKTLIAEKNNFILLKQLEKPLEVEVKIRYKADAVPAVIAPAGNGRVRVEFRNPERAITPGQAVVYYQGDYVVGGGIIVSRQS